MTKRILPAAPAIGVQAGVSFEVSARAFEAWIPSLRAASSEQSEEISILAPIGADPWGGGGVTASWVASSLRSFGGRDVTLNINSPGGNLFEGLAIYNLLREYKGKVTVKILGIAASAASIVAMAADEIQIARSAFYMIHNCVMGGVGNRHELRETADWMEPFDEAMADIYAVRSGEDITDIRALMDAETWIAGKDAVQRGYADAYLVSDPVDAPLDGMASANAALRRVELIMAKQNVPRSERRKIIQEIKAGTPRAIGFDKPSAVESPAISAQLITALEGSLERLRAVTNH